MAIAVSLEDMGMKQNNTRAAILATTLDKATTVLLQNNKSPSRKTGELDNRGSHFYLTMYWAQELVAQTDDKEFASKFVELAKSLTDAEDKIIAEMKAAQGRPTVPGGYYHPNRDAVKKIMRPSKTLNAIITKFNAK